MCGGSGTVNCKQMQQMQWKELWQPSTDGGSLQSSNSSSPSAMKVLNCLTQQGATYRYYQLKLY